MKLSRKPPNQTLNNLGDLERSGIIDRREFLRLSSLITGGSLLVDFLTPERALAWVATRMRKNNRSQQSGATIGQSIRLPGSASSSYLGRTISTNSNRRLWTISAWVKRSQLGTYQEIWSAGNSPSVSPWETKLVFDNNDNLYVILNGNSGGAGDYFISSHVFRDTNSWYHICAIFDINNATRNDRVRLFVNGSRINAPAAGNGSQADSAVGLSGQLERIGAASYAANYYLQGYIADFKFIDGLAVDATQFGRLETNTNQWVPKSYSGSYGTNGYYLDFADNSNTTSATLGKDRSGLNNDFTPSGLTVDDQVLDSPTNNFSVPNTLENIGPSVFSKAGLQWNSVSGVNAQYRTNGSIGLSSGKWYFEAQILVCGSTDDDFTVGIENPTATEKRNIANRSLDIGYYRNSTYTLVAGTNPPWSTNDHVGFCFDIDNDTVTIYKNGALFTTQTAQGLAGELWIPFVRNWVTAGRSGYTASINYGQGGLSGLTYYSSAGGRFKYAPPAGAKAISTANIAEPTIIKPKSFFDIKTFTGTGGARTISGFNFQPDLVYGHSRSAVGHGMFIDSVRGANINLYPNLTQAEANVVSATVHGGLGGFTPDGYTLALGTSTADNPNQSGVTYVGYGWKAGTSAQSGNESYNATSKLSILKYTGDGSSNRVLNHTLGTTPHFIIGKDRAVASGWRVFHRSLSDGYNLWLEQTSLPTNAADVIASASTSTITLGSAPGNINANGNGYILYVFSEVNGFSKMGSYTGNGSTNGPFIWCGFKPAFVILKNTSGTSDNWQLLDSARSPENPVDEKIEINTYTGEAANNANRVDFVSNGFKLRGTDNGSNASGNGYVFIAFAEAPFKYSRAR